MDRTSNPGVWRQADVCREANRSTIAGAGSASQTLYTCVPSQNRAMFSTGPAIPNSNSIVLTERTRVRASARAGALRVRAFARAGALRVRASARAGSLHVQDLESRNNHLIIT